jgi:hypothetical protein
MVAIEYFCIDLVCLGALFDASGIIPGLFGAYDDGFDLLLLAVFDKRVGVDTCRFKDQTEFFLFAKEFDNLFEAFGVVDTKLEVLDGISKLFDCFAI